MNQDRKREKMIDPLDKMLKVLVSQFAMKRHFLDVIYDTINKQAATNNIYFLTNQMY